ncbi:hypothetical protein CAEBREN_14314 [Caenorhabditis brenneri]|uniref:U3 small nucleolar ribonucleoprotein protein IMP3 n=1 Tax=Caenorhabditis brenneri TaxID=135651 RepID=G0P0B6_CAEBE|nr:hypothetical protein CAEBREN_14314 [Caenorhabditis brenneri]
MVRKLKTHEQKLLKKTDFMSWQVDQQGRQGEMLRKFHVTKREHYSLYNTLAAKSRELADLIKNLPESDPLRSKCTEDVLSKFYNAGLVPTADTLERIGKVTGASFARRRLPVVMRNTGMVDSVKTASDLVEQGHVRIGTKLVTDPAFMVTRASEDMITWTNASKIKRHVMDYNNTRDDFDLMD